MTQDFFDAIITGDSVKVSQLLDLDHELVNAHTEQGVSVVLLAAYYGEPGIADLLIKRGAAMDIFATAATGRLEKVQSWVEKQPDLVNDYNHDGFQPLGLAAFFGHQAIVEYLLVQGAAVNSPSNNSQHVTPLISATARGNLEITRLLISHGADVNARQINNFTAMHNAAQNGQIEMAALLLAHGAEINARSQDGRTPLAFALEKDHTVMVEYLQKQGAVS